MARAKAFFLICAGILMLSIAMDIGTEQARADFDPNGPGIIGISSAYVLTEHGEVWRWDDHNGIWVAEPDLNPPMPINSIELWDADAILTSSEEFWFYRVGTWQNCGSPPEATPTESSNWSQLKSSFGK